MTSPTAPLPGLGEGLRADHIGEVLLGLRLGLLLLRRVLLGAEVVETALRAGGGPACRGIRHHGGGGRTGVRRRHRGAARAVTLVGRRALPRDGCTVLVRVRGRSPGLAVRRFRFLLLPGLGVGLLPLGRQGTRLRFGSLPLLARAGDETAQRLVGACVRAEVETVTGNGLGVRFGVGVVGLAGRLPRGQRLRRNRGLQGELRRPSRALARSVSAVA